MPELIGQSFFAHFIQMIGILRVPLALFFAAFVFRYLGRLRSKERQQALLMFFYFFLITSAYWLIKAIKKSLLVGLYQETGLNFLGWHFDAAQVELLAKEGNAVFAVLAALAFAKLAQHIKRERLAVCMIALFAFGFLSFTVLLAHPRPWVVWAFYFYGDLFVTLMVATFFALINDSGNRRMARRLYGLIGLGGVLGGFFGSTLVASYAQRLSPSESSVLCVGTLAVMAFLAMRAGKKTAPVLTLVPLKTNAPTTRTGTTTWRSQLQSLLHSPYLLGMAFIVGLYEMVSAIMDYQFTFTVLHFISGEAIRTHFSNVYAFTNFIALVVQLFLTRFVLTHVGATKALFFLPGIALLGEAGFAVLPGLLTGSLLNTANNAVAYSLNQSAKEALYIPIAQEAKYQGKAFIDIFVFRCMKAVSIAVGGLWLTTAFAGFEGLRALSWIVFCLIAAWFVFIYKLDLYYTSMDNDVHPARRMGPFQILRRGA